MTGLDPQTGLYEQFAGFLALDDVDLSSYAGRSVPMDVVLGRERMKAVQVIKQADVVALLALLPEEFPDGAASANFDYYEPRCSHGSSLSAALHGLAAARLGRPEPALAFFRQAAATDLADTHAALDGGLHIASLGGVWMMAVLGFAGLSMADDGIRLAPNLPAGWSSLTFAVQWQGRHLSIGVDRAGRTVLATLRSGDPMIVTIGSDRHRLDRASPLAVPLSVPLRLTPPADKGAF